MGGARRCLGLGVGLLRIGASSLAEATEQAAQALGQEYQLEKVTDLKQIMAFGVMTTPALAVDGQVKVAGRIPSVEEIKKMLA
jgi:small redox-active disulfide protein 2